MYRGENKTEQLKRVRIDAIRVPFLNTDMVKMDVLRLDEIHPVVSGNKWFKLNYYLQDAVAKGAKTILTFGGAYSNHIVATAFAAKEAGLSSIGIIRGEAAPELSQTLKDAAGYGMRLLFVSRTAYLQKEQAPEIAALLSGTSAVYLVPEGGAGEMGVKGSEEILSLVNLDRYTHILCAVGTGTMLQGLAHASLSTQQVIGIPVLKGFERTPEVFFGKQGLVTNVNTRLIHGYHFGGYAKRTTGLLAFMNRFYSQYGIPTDFVYTGKLFYAISDLAAKGFFPQGSHLLAMHSGGLQGNRSLAPGSLLF